jgi:hypothetical protein
MIFNNKYIYFLKKLNQLVDATIATNVTTERWSELYLSLNVISFIFSSFVLIEQIVVEDDVDGYLLNYKMWTIRCIF